MAKPYGRARVEIIDAEYRQAGAYVSGGRHREQFIINRPTKETKLGVPV